MSDSIPTAPVKRPAAPRGLDKSGRKLWREIVSSGKYELRPDELRVLEDACREADLIDELTVAAVGTPKMVRGSHGGTVINPLISELRQHRVTLNSLLRFLRLPDEGAAGELPRSVSARKAAQSRWGKPS